jgi:phosphoenolpyruvate-protein phosphotransferase
LKDPSLLKAVRSSLEDDRLNIEAAWFDATEKYALQMEALEDEYFRARAADIRDVGRRVLRILMGIADPSINDIEHPSIVIARDLTPSDTAGMNKSFVLAFCTAEGGPTSHTAILSKALGIPAVVGIGDRVLDTHNGDQLLVDGEKGEIFINPDPATLQRHKEYSELYLEQAKQNLQDALGIASTLDGHDVEVVANIGSVEDAILALENGAEGVGLLRTEFLYLNRNTAPNELEQLSIYDRILDTMEDRPVVVRTLDVGGDKDLVYIDLGKEDNPFLGWRAIRMCLDEPDIFKTQLRALLRASPGHDLRIMFPMISTLDEVRRSKAIVDEARRELLDENYEIAEDIQTGIMVEVPSVVVLADRFAAEVDFFSIGTNDLTQYTMAAERTNERVAHLGDACHPAILRQIDRVINAAHEQGIWVGLCGELAGDPDAIPILLGLGLDEFSMSPYSIPRAKSIIRKWSMAKASTLAEKALALDSGFDVHKLIRGSTPG